MERRWRGQLERWTGNRRNGGGTGGKSWREKFEFAILKKFAGLVLERKRERWRSHGGVEGRWRSQLERGREDRRGSGRMGVKYWREKFEFMILEKFCHS